MHCSKTVNLESYTKISSEPEESATSTTPVTDEVTDRDCQYLNAVDELRRIQGPMWLVWGGFIRDACSEEPCWQTLDGFQLLTMEAHGPFSDAEFARNHARLRLESNPRLRLIVVDMPHDEADMRTLLLFLRVLDVMGARVSALTEGCNLHITVLGWRGTPWELPDTQQWASWTVMFLKPVP